MKPWKIIVFLTFILFLISIPSLSQNVQVHPDHGSVVEEDKAEEESFEFEEEGEASEEETQVQKRVYLKADQFDKDLKKLLIKIKKKK